MLHYVEVTVNYLSSNIWNVFLPILIIMAIYVMCKIKPITNLITKPSKIKFKNFVGPVSISLGAMVGTGATVGVIGSLSKLYSKGQIYFESIVFWAILGACVLIPISYMETITSKVMKMPPHKYLEILVSPIAGKVYAIAFICLYVFGFGGFQFSGVDASITITVNAFLDMQLSEINRYLFIIIPLIIFIATIVLTKKHHIFVNSVTYMITLAVFLYFIFFLMFVIQTSKYIPTFFQNILQGITNPTTAMFGLPIGLIFGLQRVIQTSETGLGALGMASLESQSEPREAGNIAIIPSVITAFIAIIGTTYITSYGVNNNIFVLAINGEAVSSIERLTGLFNTAYVVMGNFGLFVLTIFTTLSGLTTLLGSYYFLGMLLDIDENTQIKTYLIILFIAGTLAVFGFTIIFDMVDLLLFIVIGLNVIGLCRFVSSKYEEYK